MEHLSQYKTDFAQAWGAKQLADGGYDVSSVIANTIAAKRARFWAEPPNSS